MAVRRAPLAFTLGAIALTSGAAFADEAGSAPGEPLVAVDTSDPVCHESRLRCEQVETTAAPDEVVGQMKTIGPILRELRRCLNREGFTAVPATLLVRWADTTTLEVARGLDAHPCIVQIKGKVVATKSPTPLALKCTYECSGGILPTPPPAKPEPEPEPPKPPPAERKDEPAAEAKPLAEATPRSSTPSSWYGWQTLISDAASAAVLTGGLVSWTIEPTVVGYSGFLLGTPIVHAVHGNWGRGLASFGLRLLAPAVAGGIGAALNVGANGEETTAKGVVTSAGIGIGIASVACIIIDAGFLAWQSDDHHTGKNDRFRWGTF